MCSRRLRPAAAAALLVAALGSPATAGAAQPGVNIAGPDQAAIVGALGTGAKLVRMFIRWDELEPVHEGQYPLASSGPTIDAAIRQINAAGARPVFVVLGAPAWANGSSDPYVPPSPGRYAEFFARFVAHTTAVGAVAAYEIWNEPDDTAFWHGTVSAKDYAALAKQAYVAAKPRAADAAILLGPTTANNYDFIAALYAHGMKGFFDGVAVHTDTGCLVNGPDLFYRDTLGAIGRYTFLGYRTVHDVLVAHGDDKPIWMTELGWSSTGGARNSCAQGVSSGRKPDGVSVAQQAAYLTHAYQCLARDPYVVAGLWFVYADTSGRAPEEHNHYGLVDASGARKPSYDAFTRVVATNGGSAGPCGDFRSPTVAVRSPKSRQVFSSSLLVRVTSSDRGGVGVVRITARADRSIRAFRKFEKRFRDGETVSYRWRGAGRLRGGNHTITIAAVDANGNKVFKRIAVCRRTRAHRCGARR